MKHANARPATSMGDGDRDWGGKGGKNGNERNTSTVRRPTRDTLYTAGRLKFWVYGRVSRCIGGILGTRARAFTSLRRGDPSACRSPSPTPHPFTSSHVLPSCHKRFPDLTSSPAVTVAYTVPSAIRPSISTYHLPLYRPHETRSKDSRGSHRTHRGTSLPYYRCLFTEYI